MRRMLKQFLLLIFLTHYGMYSDATPLHISVGQYEANGPQQAAILVSQDDAFTWKLTSPFSQFPKLYAAGLLAVDCYEKTCISSGFYDYDLSSPVQGAVLVSNNDGDSWQLISPFLEMKNFEYAYLPAISCANRICAIVGDYTKKNNGKNEGVILISHNNGSSWEIQTPLTKLPLACGSLLNAVKCTDDICVAIGGYNRQCGNIFYNQMVILTSSNKGKTWDISLPTINYPRAERANLFDISCANNTCIAVGMYNIGKGNEAVMVISHDSGKSWALSLPLKNQPKHKNSGLGKINCTNNLCFAVGYYENLTTQHEIAVILRSEDEGLSWTQSTPFSTIPNLQTGYIESSIDCNDLFCITAGDYTVDNHPQGVILISKNRGDSWELIFPFANMPNLSYSYISSIKCINKTCVAISSYYDATKSTENQAGLVISHDGGQTWNFIDAFLDVQIYWSGILNAIANNT